MTCHQANAKSQVRAEKRKSKMLQLILKLTAVAAAFLFANLAEFYYASDHYSAWQSLSACFTAMIAVLLSMPTKSKALACYGLVYLIAAILYLLIYASPISIFVDYYFYVSFLNFGIIMHAADWVIILVGGINVFYRPNNLHNRNSSDDDIFDARVGVH